MRKCKDSALGNHSGDFADFLKKHRLTPSGVPCFKATADLKSSSALKSTKSPTSNTAIPRILEETKWAGYANATQVLESQSGFTKQVENLEPTFESNTANPRICREDKQAECEKSAPSSLRASFARVAIHTNNAKILESTFEKSQKMDCHAIAAALACNDRVRGVDRHADFQSARNDGEIAASQKVDSRENAKSLNEPQNTKTQSVFDSETAGLCGKNTGAGSVFDNESQAAGCLMKKRGCAAFCAEISLVGFSTNKRQTPRFFAKQAKRCKPKPKQASLVKSQCLHYKKAL